jgi:tRNA G18 (ribose-2'-O)-methylase SpoU
MIKLNALQLRKGEHQIEKSEIPRHEIYIILDNILDTYNIGSVFRLADAVGAKKVYLCGGTETPPNHRIKKASINTTELVDWEYFPDTLEAIKSIRQNIPEVKIVAVELAENAIPYTEYKYQLPVAILVGHESDGVSEEVMKACDAIVELPMYGINISLNVMVSLAIALYEVIRQTSPVSQN